MQATEHTFKSWDGTELFYRAWLPEKPASRAILLFHRGHEHAGRWQETVEALGLEDFAVFAWDQRGHGRSPGERGDAETLSAVIKDADAWARHICLVHGVAMQDMAVVAHSVGAVIAAGWVHDFGPPIRALVLGAPAFRVKLYVPLAIPLLRLRYALLGNGFVKSYVKAKMLTHDAGEAEKHRADPLIFRQISVRVLLELEDLSTRLLADAGAITTPTLVLSAGKDWVVKRGAQRDFVRRLSSGVKRLEVLPGFYHDIFHETGRQQVTDRVRSFILDAFAQPACGRALSAADKSGFTFREHERLRRPGSPHWALVRCGMQTVGRLSSGIRLGWEAGFDSGLSLDYVYENRPRGITPLGRLIDHFYLNSAGWRGIRVRGQNLSRMLRECIEQVRAAGRPAVLLDIASGPGRYILQTMREMNGTAMTAILRDYKEENVQAARRMAQELVLGNVTIMRGDAFDRASLAGTTPRPTIAIVSGLYELFPENEGILRSLHGIADAMDDGGLLIYTNQPWHPQMEFIARVLTNREGKPWIMRRRTQAEMDELVRSAGFQKLQQDIDPWGIFTVSVARRVR